jgi:hypothetical protein
MDSFAAALFFFLVACYSDRFSFMEILVTD